MNERIRELFKRAGGKTSARNLASNPVQVVETHELWDDRIEKFAELIVRECMTLCIKVENDVELSDYEGGFKDGALLCYQEIQEHFGVEE